MALHIKDEATDLAVRLLAERRGLSLTEAIRTACEEALSRDEQALPLRARLSPLLDRLDAIPRTGRRIDKGFFDLGWEPSS